MAVLTQSKYQGMPMQSRAQSKDCALQPIGGQGLQTPPSSDLGPGVV